MFRYFQLLTSWRWSPRTRWGRSRFEQQVALGSLWTTLKPVPWVFLQQEYLSVLPFAPSLPGPNQGHTDKRWRQTIFHFPTYAARLYFNHLICLFSRRRQPDTKRSLVFSLRVYADPAGKCMCLLQLKFFLGRQYICNHYLIMIFDYFI